MKLAVCNAALKLQVLSSVKNGLSPKPKLRRARIELHLAGVVSVGSDDELMAPAPGGIDHWIERALELA